MATVRRKGIGILRFLLKRYFSNLQAKPKPLQNSFPNKISYWGIVRTETRASSFLYIILFAFMYNNICIICRMFYYKSKMPPLTLGIAVELLLLFYCYFGGRRKAHYFFFLMFPVSRLFFSLICFDLVSVSSIFLLKVKRNCLKKLFICCLILQFFFLIWTLKVKYANFNDLWCRWKH